MISVLDVLALPVTIRIMFEEHPYDLVLFALNK